MDLKKLILAGALLTAGSACLSKAQGSKSLPSLGPLWGRYFVAAGLGEPGFKDGAFADAEFQSPSGLALSKDGTLLYVSDRGNDAVRRVAFTQNSKVDTLFGGPGNAILISPTALVLSLDEKNLYVVDGRNRVMRLPSAGGAASALEVTGLSATPQTLSATALVRNPNLDVLYAWYAPTGSLYALDASQGKASLLGSLPDLAGALGSLMCANGQLFLLRDGNGELRRFLYGAQAVLGVGTAWNPSVALSSERWGIFGPGVHGLAAVDNGNGRPMLHLWDQAHALFKQIDTDSGVVSDYPLRDYEGNWLVQNPPFLQSPFQDDPTWDKSRAELRPLMKGPLAFADDAAHTQLYVAEADGHRVLGLGTPDWNAKRDDSLFNFRCGSKIPGVTRILLLGASMVMQDDHAIGEQPTVETGFGTQFELYLNLFSALEGKNRHFQVLQSSVVLGALGGGVTSYLANLPAPLRALNADEVVTLIEYSSINCELVGMTRTKCVDDIPEAQVDPDFFGQTKAEMVANYGPVHRDFLNWVKTAPPAIKQYVDVNTEGNQLTLPRDLYFLDAMQYPDYSAWVLKVQAKVVKKAQETAQALHMRYTQILMPERNQLAPGENSQGGYSFTETTQGAWIDAGLAKIAEDNGAEFLNLTQPMRLIEPTVFPIVSFNGQHYRDRGLHWAAMLAAWQYVQRLP